MSATYELWLSEDESSYTFLRAEERDLNPMPADAKRIWTVVAETWEEAQTQKHVFLGWEPYKPMDA